MFTLLAGVICGSITLHLFHIYKSMKIKDRKDIGISELTRNDKSNVIEQTEQKLND
jgi:hypothetical protein